MKYMIEEAFQLDSFVEEELNESTGKTEKNYYISGIFSTPEVKNRNGRIYPMQLWEREVENFQKEIKTKSISTLGEFEHPSRVSVDPMLAVMRITEVKIKDRMVVGKAKILNNNSERTNQLKALIDEGIKIGVSSRGVGKVGRNNIVEEFKLTTWDVVTEPSDYNANLSGLVESLNESIGKKEFIITESGSIDEVKVCTSDACHLFEKKDIQSALKDKFSEFLSEMMGNNPLPKSSGMERPDKKFRATFSFKDPMTRQRRTTTLYFKDKMDALKYGDLKHYEMEAFKDLSK